MSPRRIIAVAVAAISLAVSAFAIVAGDLAGRAEGAALQHRHPFDDSLATVVRPTPPEPTLSPAPAPTIRQSPPEAPLPSPAPIIRPTPPEPTVAPVAPVIRQTPPECCLYPLASGARTAP